MESPPFVVEDQTDEDFFDKLVDGEVDGVQSGSNFTNHVESSDVHALAKLSIDDIGSPVVALDNVHDNDIAGDHHEKFEKDDSNSCKLEGEGNVGSDDSGHTIESSELGDLKSVHEFSDQVTGEESAFDSVSSGSMANGGGGIKQVQWSAFGSGTGGASYSDFFNEFGDSGADPFAEVAGSSVIASASDPAVGVSSNQVNKSSSCGFVQNEETQQHVSSIGRTTENQDESSSQCWENLYPGWKYDTNTGQWYQVDSSHAMVNNVGTYNASDQSAMEGTAGDSKSDVYYLQQTAQSVAGSVAENSMTGTLSYWNQNPQGSTEYPAHMVFDPQYPGWYYDTIAQEWRSLDFYTPSINQSASLDYSQHISNGNFTSVDGCEQNMTYGQGEQINNYSHQQEQFLNWRDSGDNHHQQHMNAAQTEPFRNSEAVSPQNTHMGNGYMSNAQVHYSADHGGVVTASEKSSFYEQTRQGFDSNNGSKGFQGFGNGVIGSQNFSASEKLLHPNNQHNMEFEQQYTAAYFNSPEALNFSQQPFQNSKQLSYASNEGRSSAGRPPHALVTFGFGGKLIVMKDPSTSYAQSTYASQGSAGSVINVLDTMEAASLKSNGPDVGVSSCDYFHTLCQQSFPGPLVSGNVGSKELNKWIDDRIANYSIPNMEYSKSEALRMLFCLLKIACQFYGKLRSGFGADLGSKENDCPESALAKLFASAKRNGSQFSAIAHCLQNMPSEGQIQATANEVQMLLVSGKRMEALQCAQEGQLWGPALVIAAMLGEQFYGETVKQMALHQLVAGSPLRTLCLLLAGKPAEVFSNPTNNPPTGVNVTQPVQIGPAGMLDDWEENLAIITANKTSGDELVITHLGDCLWKEKGEVTAAHICYLVAEANIESYSESARLCLVGADHLKCPRTYSSPDAIQRTELYEYAKVQGNSQFILLPFQPYKLVYACMLAEVGRLSDSLKYCQAALRSLKSGRSSEVDAWRHMLSSLEERIKIHQQGGYAANLAPTKLVGKLLNFFDNTAHRVVGGLPPPIPSQSHSNIQRNEPDKGPRVSTSQSTMAMSSLMPSASTENSNRKLMHNRSISEPDMGRTPRKVESPKESNSSEQHDNASTSGGSSRFGRFGSQIFQKTVGLVLRSRADRQAKLGEKNKFYYDGKLKRWVEEGAEPPAEEPALAPPPTTTAFMNGMPDHDKKGVFVNGTIRANGESEFKATNAVEKFSGTPPIPPGSNQFSARGRMGVRARYVDTFNKGGGTQANSFQSPLPLIPAVKPAIGNAKFFIPTAAAGGQETDNIEDTQGGVVADEDTSTSDRNHSFSPPQMGPPSLAMHRHPSTESLPNIGTPGTTNGNGSLPPHSRRTLSWSGDLGDPLNPLSPGEARPLGEALGMSPSTYMPSNSSTMSFTSYSTTLADDLQEVQL